MATEKIYLEAPTLEAEAMVMHAGHDERGTWLELDRTIFHAQGGGQRADRGTIAGLPVLHVAHARAGNVRHYVDVNHGKAPLQYDDVQMVVDPQERHKNARYHTAGHLIAAVAERHCPGVSATGGHHWPGQARIEFSEQTQIDLHELEDQVRSAVQEAIEASLPVAIEGDPHRSRLVRIGDYPAVGCGGTHVERLSALGHVEIRKVRRKNGALRISYEVA